MRNASPSCSTACRCSRSIVALTVFIRYAAEQRHLVKSGVTEETIDSALLHQPSYALYGGA